MAKRAIIVVMDSVGVGALPDAHLYGDQGSNTLKTIAEKSTDFRIPHLEQLGIGNIIPITTISPVENCTASFAKMAEKSPGKDTTTGHWEIAGIVLEHPFPVYPNGFPEEIVNQLEDCFGVKIIGNKAASGTAIIEELGEEHLKTGKPIVYTSADSVLQIATHKEAVPLEKLYEFCRKAREIMQGKHAVGRVIARPFVGLPGQFERTNERKDFSLLPPEPNLLLNAYNKGLTVTALGKIEDIFAGVGISNSYSSHDNKTVLADTIKALETIKDTGIIFANLVDFDMLYGHRNDIQGYADALMEFDAIIPLLLERLGEEDIFILTADHGCDPGTESTDHSREYVPLLIYGSKLKSGIDLGTRQTFADLGQTVCDYLGIDSLKSGTSFLNLLTLDS
jgi:phosphopentomutase